MSRPAGRVMTQAPAVLVVTDPEGTPDAYSVGSYFQRISGLWTFTAELAVLRGEGRYSDFLRGEVEDPHYSDGADWVDARIGRLGVGHIRFASPLETVLTAIAKDLAPLAYVMGAMLVFERAVKLVMEWQRHRAQLLQDRNLSGPAFPPKSPVDELTEDMPTGPSIDSVNRAHKNAEYLMYWAPIIRVERIDGPQSSSDD